MRFLFVKTSALGDILHSFLALNYLREKFPHANIDWIVEEKFSKLLQTHPQIDRVIVLPKQKRRWLSFLWSLREKKYEAVFDLQGNCKSALVLCFLKTKNKIGFGKKMVKEWPNLLVTNYKVDQDPTQNIRLQYLELLQRYFEDDFIPKDFFYDPFLTEEEKILLKKIFFFPDCKKIMICFGSNWPNKQPEIFIYQKMIQTLLSDEKIMFYLVWGNPKEKKEAEKLHMNESKHTVLLPYMSLSLWKGVLKRMDGFLGVDSGALHLAEQCFVPTFSLFGPTSAQIFKPLGVHHQSFQGNCPYHESFIKQCPKLRSCPTGNCLKKIPIDIINQKLMRWWQSLYK